MHLKGYSMQQWTLEIALCQLIPQSCIHRIQLKSNSSASFLLLLLPIARQVVTYYLYLEQHLHVYGSVYYGYARLCNAGGVVYLLCNHVVEWANLL